MGINPTYQANTAVAIDTTKDEAEQKERYQIAAKMSGSFDALANAAVTKAKSIDSCMAIIISLTKTILELTETNKKLVNQLVVARATTTPSPRFAQKPPTPSAEGQTHPVLEKITETGHCANTTGGFVSCC